ncbi:MAG: hypothetical protein KA027_01910 [Candidatus Methanofastidiosum sp.]|nr:hypothetical protein [Methanofastidiosum sp.]
MLDDEKVSNNFFKAVIVEAGSRKASLEISRATTLEDSLKNEGGFVRKWPFSTKFLA